MAEPRDPLTERERELEARERLLESRERMLDTREAQLDERRMLPDQRPGRRGKPWSLRSFSTSMGVHLSIALLCLLIFLLLPKAPPPPLPPPETMSVFFAPPVKVPSEKPVESRTISDRDAQAQSPGQAPERAAGDTSPQDASGRRPEPEVREVRERPRPERRPEPEPVKVAQLPVTPQIEPPPRERDPREVLEEQRRALARALRGGNAGDSNWGELAMKGSSGLGTDFGGLDFQIESKSDVDWGPWGSKTVAIVKRNWLSIMPVAAKVGMQGIVQVRFRVMRDGEIRDFEALSESGVIPLDQAVKDALLRLSNPLPELPIPENGVEDSIRVTYTFIYNLRDERAQREWQRRRWHEARANGAG